MEYIFLNKNKVLFSFNYDDSKKIIDKIIHIDNKNYMPLSLVNYVNNDDLIVKFNEWLNNRYSKNSLWFKDVKWKYGDIYINNDFTIKSYGLSLSDQYWLKPVDSKENWEDVNFFHNDFKYQAFIENDLKRVYDYNDVDVLYSPNITTGGDLDKAWAIIDGKRILYKASNTFLGLEPLNEFIASKICDILELSHANYEIKILSNLDNKIMVSSCETFINEDTEFIPASNFINGKKNYLDSFNEYVNILTNLGISNVKEKLQKMVLLDFLIGNHDRHLNNFGVIRNVNTLEYVDIAPIFDSGRAMSTEYPPLSVYIEEFFLFSYEKATKLDCLDLFKDLKLTQKQIDELNNIPDLYNEYLEKYYEYTNLKGVKENVEHEIIKIIKENVSFILYLVREGLFVE